MSTKSCGYPTVSFLEIDGKVLSGEEFEDYCKDHGLCRRCARVRTHKRVLKLFGRGKKWEPMTLHDEEGGGDYTVYKGYCLQPTCYTIGQAKRLLGESGSASSMYNGSNHGNNNDAGSTSGNGNGTGRRSRRQRLAERFKGAKRRPSKRKPKTNPDTGSVMAGAGGDDDFSISSDMSGFSQMSGMSNMSGMSGMSGFSGIGAQFRKRSGRRKNSKGNKRSNSNASSASSVSSFGSIDEDDMTIDSTITTPTMPLQAMIVSGEPSPIVSHRVEQLILYDYFTVLDLSKVELRQEDIDAVVRALEQTKTIEAVTMNKCKLKDDGLEQICSGLKKGNHLKLKTLSLRQNIIGNRGAQALDFLLKGSPTLTELDLSENSISSRGAASLLAALHANQSQTVLQTLNLSQNEIWDMDDGSFLKHNTTLKVFNLDGNFMHDEGAEQIAKAISANPNCQLEKLYLGWNGISDDGATALAKMIEVNATLQVLGLAENDISNTGARAILSSLAVNTSVREISGLYHNQIDRKFIIVAIKRLLHRYGERTGIPASAADHDSSLRKLEEEEKAPPTTASTSAPPPVVVNKSKGEEKVPVDDEHSEASTSSINWAAQLYSMEDVDKTAEELVDPDKRKTSVALEAIEHWDWGTFGIEEIEASRTPPTQMPDVEPEQPMTKAAAVGDAAAELTPHHSGRLPVDRVTVFQSAPLAYFNRTTTEHHDIPLLDFDYEARALKEALADKEAIGADIELAFENATTDRFSVFFSQQFSPVMHISCHGHPDCLALENGFGYMQALPAEDLKRFVSGGNVRVVFVSSCHSRNMADAFLKAGVPHVVCCQRESVFRDDGPIEFAKAFYQALAKNKTLKEAFKMGVDHVQRSPLVKSARNVGEGYLLLPYHPENSSYHNVKVFFQKPLAKRPEIPEVVDTSMLPKIPDQFVGREVDMYEILESLRVDDVVRVGGSAGSGKASVISAVSRYILGRPKSFLINSVHWLPAPKDVEVDPDTLYGDLCQVLDWLVVAEDDIWDEDDYTECRERIMIELENTRTILVIDGRIFTTEASGENLERFCTHLLNEASVKIVLLTAHEGSGASRTNKRSRSEETMISIGPLGFKASALLFGNACNHISISGNPVVTTADEFADFLVPPSVKKLGADQKNESRRQQKLYEMMGKGIPTAIMKAASDISEKDLDAMLRFAQRPDVHVDSAGALEGAITKRTTQKDKAIKGKNYLRAQDLGETLEELESLKRDYPSLTDLKNKETDMKKDFSALLAARKYSEANQMKRKILALKKTILRENHAKPVIVAKYTATGKLQELQAQMNHMMAMAERMSMDKSLSELDRSKTLQDDAEQATFRISREEGSCSLEISCGSTIDYLYSGGMCGIVCWTNESCDLTTYELGRKFVEAGGHNFTDDVSKLATLVDTSWGPVKCATGEAVMLGPRSYMKLTARYLILAVSPLSPTNDDDEWDGDENQDADALHYLDTGVRAAYRSSFRKIKNTGLEAVGIPTITTKNTGDTYEKSLRVGLLTLIEESKLTKLNSIHLLASSGKEATILIKMALEMGLGV